MGVEVDATRAAVWRALTVREEVLHWRPGIVGFKSPEASFPTEGRRFRWRCRLHDIPIELQETPGTIVPPGRFESEVRLGLFHFRQIFTLVPTPSGTRVTLQIEASNRMPLVGGSLDRFDVRRFLVELAANYLQALRDWCEREPALLPVAAASSPRAQDAHGSETAPTALLTPG